MIAVLRWYSTVIDFDPALDLGHLWYGRSISTLSKKVKLRSKWMLRWEMLDQTLLAPVGDIVLGNINAFTVCPMIILHKSNQYWYCTTSKTAIFPGDIVYGKHTNDGWIRTVSIQAIPSCA